jgi:hypothetical protein
VQHSDLRITDGISDDAHDLLIVHSYEKHCRGVVPIPASGRVESLASVAYCAGQQVDDLGTVVDRP